MRVQGTGLVAFAVYVLLGLAWAFAGPPFWALMWIPAVAIAGVYVPGVANQVSLARAYLAAPALLYALQQNFAVVAVVMALAGLTDLVDGTIARRLDRPTNLGGGLDPVVDGIFMGALVIGLGLGGVIPMWLGLVVIARYLLPALAGGVLLAWGRRPELRHTLTGQISTTLILVLLGGIVLLRGLNQDPGNLVPAAEIVIPIATVATFIHLAWALRAPVNVAEGG